MLKIYHNPRCQKSRQTLQLIEESGEMLTIVEYLKETPSEDQLREILKKLGMKAEEIVRKSEAVYKEQFKGKTLSEDEWIAAMVEYPSLIERPIVVKGDKAVLGRPPENVKSLL
ncbi:arsenate reductase [Roseivirga ehrenbergii]|uniref:Arsenate reductase n=1 Tax=Roseivirga ehrenbergii (strain DSM 102268 / JCM 13514 / KCTC 12282 / NCIMB 14502 / KMM 6017) TaxID=279360 RepID=A0A150XTI0_ROSEK|nr:arsenate reductase (glutaredoxin) [Roseivirga ehrenbergii]KYG81922.1 arsenate reductase [Roseivirga ehrenbergii]TCL01736.1 arsenate reductase [Roseivirga ehrenbergii]